MDLVQYDSDGSDDATEPPASVEEVTAAPSRSLSELKEDPPPAKRYVLRSRLDLRCLTAYRRKVLPGLPSAYTVHSGDDPSKHQGRTRSRPFVEGEYNAHLFLSCGHIGFRRSDWADLLTWIVPVSRAFGKMIDDILDDTRQACSGHTLHSNLAPLSNAEASDDQEEKRADRYLPLHVSLTHPLPLRRSQIDTFRLDVQQAIKRLSLAPFRLSFAGQVTGYVNGRRTGGEGSGKRAFLALRTSAGTFQVGRDRASS